MSTSPCNSDSRDEARDRTSAREQDTLCVDQQWSTNKSCSENRKLTSSKSGETISMYAYSEKQKQVTDSAYESTPTLRQLSSPSSKLFSRQRKCSLSHKG